MKKIIKEITVYEFEELNKDIQDSLIENEKKIAYEDYMDYIFEEDMDIMVRELVSKYFGDNTEFVDCYYDFSYSQGSGSMIEFTINIADLNKKYKIFSDDEIRFMLDKDIINDIRVIHDSNRYCHEYTFMINHDYYNDWEFDDIKEEYDISKKEFDTIDNRFYKLVDIYNKHKTESQFVQDIIDMNKELTKNGYSLMENYTRDCDIDCIKDSLCENLYLESGEVYYE